MWILGAPDPEMEEIEDLLTKSGQAVGYAAVGGQRVHPGNAYQTTGIAGDFASIPANCQVIAVECGGFFSAWLSIDHHKPGDVGYGRPPAEFLPASSLGQVILHLAKSGHVLFGAKQYPTELGYQTGEPQSRMRFAANERQPGWILAYDGPDMSSNSWDAMVPEELVLTAAADHCLGAAYQGKCPGVDPDALMKWRATTRAKFQGISELELLRRVEVAREALRAAIQCGVCLHSSGQLDGLTCTYCAGTGRREYADFSGTDPIPEMPEAAAREGIPFTARVKDKDGRTKIVLQAAPHYLVKKWMQDNQYDLVDIYGDPERGFAGGYIR